MATTLGGTTLASPAYAQEGYTQAGIDVGVMHDLADGSSVYDSVTSKLRFRLVWNGITEAERNTIYTKYLVKTSQAFSPPDSSGTFTVFVVPNTWSCSYLNDSAGTVYYFCQLELVEAA